MAVIHTFSVLAAVALITVVSAHSNVGYPRAYNPTACKASESWCKGACPPIYKSGGAKARNSPDTPSAVWKRGQTVEITWHKNNHIGGFYRRSLVPVDKMFEHSAHKLTAFDYGCWSQGSFQCGQNDVCGADAKGKAYKNTVTIPSVFPDGDYVFAQVWYGGLHWRGKYPKYSDYFGCSFVKIQGGTPLVKSATATFTGPEKKCASGSTRPLQCGGESCGDECGLEKCPPESVQVTVPDEFKNGAVPKVFLENIDSDAVASAGVAKNPEVVVLADDPLPPVADPSNSPVPAPISNDNAADVAGSPSPAPVSAAEIAEELQVAKEVEEEAAADALVGQEEAAAPKAVVEGPIKSIRVFVGQEMEKELLDGEKANISLNGKGVSFEGYTDGEKVGTMYFKINGKTDKKTESAPPYVFRGNVGTDYIEWPESERIMNEEFTFEVVVWNGNKRYASQVSLTLTE